MYVCLTNQCIQHTHTHTHLFSYVGKTNDFEAMIAVAEWVGSAKAPIFYYFMEGVYEIKY